VGHIGRSSVRTGGVHLLLRILHGRSSDGPSDHASVTTGAPVLVCLIALLAPSVQGINASPAPIALRQPDGAAIQLHIRGDEFCHWFEDERGYAVVRDREAYVYARADADGRMVPTALRVGRHDPESAGLKIGLRPSPGIRRGTSPAARLPAREISVADAATPEIPASSIMAAGVVRNLVILCKFKDHDLATKTRTSNDFDVIFNRVGGDPTLAPSGSVRDYFTEASYGVIDLQSTVLAWVTLPSNEAYYADGQDGLGSYPKNSQRMVEDALNLVDPVVDFGQFDANNDGYVDAIDIIHSGYGAETGGGGGNWIWSHQWSLWALPRRKWTSQDRNASGGKVNVYDYHTEAALWGTSGTAITRIGVICHETGHFLGLPDLYDTDGSSEGVGSYCLMANAWGFDFTQRHPPHPSAWCKIELGWVTPTVIGPGTYAAPQVESNTSIFKISTGYPAGEYLLIENRQPVGFESDMPQGGLAIWHIDEAKSDNTAEGYPGQSGWPANNNHYRVALLQADGLYQMEKKSNRGDGNDVYHGGGVHAITHVTVPSTDRYQNGIVASSSNTINQISSSGSTMTFVLVGALDPYPFTATPASGSRIDVAWAPNASTDAVMVAWNTNASFGTPSGSVAVGATLSGGGTVLYNGSAYTVAHTGLTRATPYYYKAWSVRSGPTYSSGTAVSTTTAYPVPFAEGFEHAGALPIGWTQEYVTGSLGWIASQGGAISNHPAQAHGGSYNALLYIGEWSTQKTKLITPLIDFENATLNPQLTFWHYMQLWETDQDELRIYYRTNSLVAWTLLATYTNDAAAWTPRTVALPNPGCSYSLAFEGTAHYGYGVCVDDVLITATVPVPTHTTRGTPYTWLDLYDLVTGGNYEAADVNDTDSDTLAAWQEYIAGTVPTNAASVFRAGILISNDWPWVSWTPDLGSARIYTVVGKTNLADSIWSTTNANSHFFRVNVTTP